MKKQLRLLAIPLLVGMASLYVSCEKDLMSPGPGASALKKGGGGDGQGTVTRNPLFIPVVVSPTGLLLSATPGMHDLGGGKMTVAWEYNGSLPGPTVVANTGSQATINFQNNLPEKSITHWHGMIVDHQNDGQPVQAVPAGSNYAYDFPIINRAALNWYHPHPHELTGKQVYNGLAGAFIIRDAEEAAFNLPSGNYEVPLIIRDATLSNKTGNLDYKPAAGGMFGKFPLVNGTRDPYLEVERAVYRFRVLNGSNSRVMDLTVDNGASMILIGNDGGLLPSSSVQPTITMSNGERIDILIDFRQFSNGTKVMMRDTRAPWDLIEFRVTGNSMIPYSGSLSTSSSITPLGTPARTRTFSFDGMSKINGLEYEMSRIDFTVPFGQTELWTFTTNGNAPHPVHIHGASFQVVSRSGGRGQLFPWEAGWKDTVLLEDGETVSILIRFEHYTGVYLIHCHKLEHEDMGMMSNFEVVP